VVYRNAWMTVREDEVVRADGSTGIYGVVDKPDFALVLPLHRGGYYVVEQYRYPVGGRFWEFPQGSWSLGGARPGPPADAAELARRELREETGLRAAYLDHIGRIPVAYGYSSQGCDVFVATDLTEGRPDREPAEADMRSHWISAEQLDDLVRDGALRDAVSLAALALWERTGHGRAS
jgi:8-oxo-dGTP pyrophosphatase MutT (NUDIX family)